MKTVLRLISTIHGLMAILFACAALVLIVIAARVAWVDCFRNWIALPRKESLRRWDCWLLPLSHFKLRRRSWRKRSYAMLKSVRQRASADSCRAFWLWWLLRRIEGLVATFKAIHEDMTELAYAAGLLISVGVVLAGWGVFVRLNRYAEELEPEGMEAAKREDRKLK